MGIKQMIMSKIDLKMKMLRHEFKFTAATIAVFSTSLMTFLFCLTQAKMLALIITNVIGIVSCVIALWYFITSYEKTLRNADTELENFVNVAIEHTQQTKTLDEILEEERNHIPEV